MNSLSSPFGKFNKDDAKHLAVEALLTGLLASIGVFGAYATNHSADMGVVGPILVFVCGLAASAIKKTFTDNTETPSK